MQAILTERQKRRKTKMASSPAQTKYNSCCYNNMRYFLSYNVRSLVQSVKTKATSFNELRKQRKRPTPF